MFLSKAFYLTLFWGGTVCAKTPAVDFLHPDDENCESKMTCLNRCGKTSSPTLDFLCNCDEDCRFFGDCCKDYTSRCEVGMVPVFLRARREVECTASPRQRENRGSAQHIDTGYFIVSACPPSFPADDSLSLLCDYIKEDQTFHIDDGIFFKNRFCYRCWKISGETGINKLRGRFCIPRLQGCAFPLANPVLDKNCDHYLRPLIYRNPIEGTNEIYRNIDCLKCTHPDHNPDDIFCYDKRLRIQINESSERENPVNQTSLLGNFPVLVYAAPTPRKGQSPAVPTNVGFEPNFRKLALKKKELLETLMTGNRRLGLPESISVLINFGLDDSRVMYSSGSGGSKCSKDEIWDPFTKICRVVYCQANFNLIDFHCRQPPWGNGDFDVPILLPSRNVTVTFNAFITTTNKSSTVDCITKRLSDNFFAELVEALEVSWERFSELNITFKSNISFFSTDEIMPKIETVANQLVTYGVWNESDRLTESDKIEMTDDLESRKNGFEYIIEFTLADVDSINSSSSDETPTDQLISLLAERIFNNFFLLAIDDLRIEIVSMHETSKYSEELLYDWCRGGVLRSYSADGFAASFINLSHPPGPGTFMQHENQLLNWTMEIKILSTNIVYKEGYFVANLLFHGVCHKSEANISGQVTVCEDRAELNCTDCVMIKMDVEKFEWPIPKDFPDHYTINYTGESLLGIKRVLHHWDYTVMMDGVLVGIEPPIYFSTLAEKYLSLIMTSTSSICLALTLVTYTIFKELRNLPGCNMMLLSLDTLCYQVLFLFGVSQEVAHNYPEVCQYIAIAVHYLVLSVFLWNHVMAWDLYQTFGKRSLLSRVRSTRHIIKYAIYAKGIPLVIIIFCVWLDRSESLTNLRMGYGKLVCWIRSEISSLIFVGTPLAIVYTSNIVMYIRTVSSIRHVSKKAKAMGRTQQNGFSDLLVYIKIFAMLGFSWIFGLASIPLSGFNGEVAFSVKKICIFSYVIFNGLQGIFIFTIFTANARVYNLYRSLFLKVLNTLAPRKQETRTFNCCPHHEQKPSYVISTSDKKFSTAQEGWDEDWNIDSQRKRPPGRNRTISTESSSSCMSRSTVLTGTGSCQNSLRSCHASNNLTPERLPNVEEDRESSTSS